MSAKQFAAGMRRIHQNALADERAKLELTRAALESWGADAKVYMRAKAEWKNRTGRARWGNDGNPIQNASAQFEIIEGVPFDPEERGLDWRAIHPADLLHGGAIALVSDAPYGIYLETARGAEYAIILPAVVILGPQLVTRLKEIWN